MKTIAEKHMPAGRGMAAGVKFPAEAKPAHILRDADGFFKPVLGPLMQRRRTVALLATTVAAMMASSAGGITTWQCPLRSALGVACPGCGLTRAMVLLVEGNWQAAIALHAFAPVVLMVGILLAAGSALPVKWQQKVAARVTDFERRTGIVALLLLSALIYWILRICHLI